MAYQGSCHCGAVTFSVEAEIPAEAMSCNCSHCRRKGFLMTFVPSEAFSLASGAERLGEYRFNKHAIGHQFCQTCGCAPFAQGARPDGTAITAINLRCVPEADLDALTIKHIDGARL
jgi:hypothetical protein